MKTIYEQLRQDKNIEQELNLDVIPYFRIDNVEKYLTNTDAILHMSELPSVRPPFKKLFMEYTNSYGIDISTLIAVELTDSEKWENLNSVHLVVYVEEIFIKFLVKCYLDINGKLVVWGDETGSGYMTIHPCEHVLDNIESSRWDEIKDYVTRSASIAMFALGLMSCKNVDRIYVEPQSGRKRRKSKDQYRISYHVLSIRPMGARKVYDPGEKTGKHQPLHICRGHFKTFTDENPLFGKWVGTYWWEQQIRSDRKYGVSHKDYKIETPDVNLVDRMIEKE